MGITYTYLEGSKRLFREPTGRDDLDHIEADCLGKRPALSHDHGITLTGTEAGRQMCRNVRVALLISLVLLHKVKIVTAHNDGLVHFRGVDNSGENTAADGYISRERALLVDVLACTLKIVTPPWLAPTDFTKSTGYAIGLRRPRTFTGAAGGPKSQTNVLVPPHTLLPRRSLSNTLPDTTTWIDEIASARSSWSIHAED